jgi:predicted HTH domain antitoxin
VTLTLQTPTREKDNETEDVLNVRVPQDPAERERLAVMLYDLRAVSQGNGARIAGLTRAAFFDALGRHGVTPYQYDDEEDALSDLKTLADARTRAEAQANDSPIAPL